MAEVERRSETIWPASSTPEVAGIDLKTKEQAQLLSQFEAFYKAPLPFERSNNPQSRYFRPNDGFHFQDAFMLHAMIRHFRPQRLVEIGCGMSSCVTLDTCEALRLNTELTFIDPYPERLLSFIRAEDRQRFSLVQKCVQDVPDDLFTSLKANDILFIDTSHASKVGGDVNDIYFRILPLLAPGVVIHAHDMWYPFEYPKDWLYKGIFWNEAYLLRALLMFNPAFEILMFNNYLNRCLTERVRKDFPMFLDEPGASLWFRRVQI